MRKTKKIIRRILTIIIVLLFVFAASFVGFGYLVNKYSPEVDVKIGENTQYNPDEKIANIDDRLKEIQNEDNSILEENSLPDNYAEMEKKPEKTEKTVKEEPALKNTDNKKEEETAKTKKTNVEEPKPKAPVPQKLAIDIQLTPQAKTRVFVGYYNSLEEAVIAKNELDEHLPNTSPFIKEQSGYYIIQVGVYSNQDKAVEMYNKVKELRFPAKMKTE